MKHSKFIFSDLSTYDLDVAKQFYSKVFDWDFEYTGDGYHMSYYANKEVSGLYETPKKFKNMNMPSFWMSYIQVENIDKTIENAKKLGGIIELVDKDQPIGKVALIRDPLGAGFTVYEGTFLNARYENQINALVWNELFVSDFSKVKSFYQGLFNWSFKTVESNRYLIQVNNSDTIGAVQEVSNAVKGEKEYWGVFFGVDSLDKVKQRVIDNGGKLIYEDPSITALADPFDAFFHIVPLQKQKALDLESSSRSNGIRWKVILGLALIVLSIFSGWHWLWGLFFGIWVFLDLRSGHTHLMEPISKKTDPILYWIVVSVWTVLGVYSLAYYLWPHWFLI